MRRSGKLWGLLAVLASLAGCREPLAPACFEVKVVQNGRETRYDCSGHEIERTYVIEGHRP